MAYITGDLILDDHYNIFATGNAAGTGDNNVANLNTVWGVGTGDKGYGQSSPLSSVSAGTTVTATQWTTLLGRLNTILTHQAGSGSGITNPTAGSVIAYISTLEGKINDAYNNRLTFNNTRGATGTGSNLDGTWNTTTPTTFQQVRTLTFGSADQARYFFNCGGRVNLILTTVSGTDTAKETAWTNLLNNGIGTFSIDQSTCQRSGTGYTVGFNGTGTGYWDLTGADAELFQLNETTAAYSTNDVEIFARVAGSAGSNGGLGDQLIITINYNDDATDSSGTGEFNDGINMTMRTRIDILYPETTNLSNVWGAVSVSATTN